jgi:hypothetical protein
MEDQALRDRAVQHLRKRREFTGHVLAYLLINSLIVVIWATVAGRGFFWPMFPILGWGIGVFFHGWDVFFAEPSEEQIRRQMQRMS